MKCMLGCCSYLGSHGKRAGAACRRLVACWVRLAGEGAAAARSAVVVRTALALAQPL